MLASTSNRPTNGAPLLLVPIMTWSSSIEVSQSTESLIGSLDNTRPGSAYSVLEVISPSSIRFKRETIVCFRLGQGRRIKRAGDHVVSLPRELPRPLFHLQSACLLLKPHVDCRVICDR